MWRACRHEHRQKRRWLASCERVEQPVVAALAEDHATAEQHMHVTEDIGGFEGLVVVEAVEQRSAIGRDATASCDLISKLSYSNFRKILI